MFDVLYKNFTMIYDHELDENCIEAMKRMLIKQACDEQSLTILTEYLNETDQNLADIDLYVDEQWEIVKQLPPRTNTKMKLAIKVRVPDSSTRRIGEQIPPRRQHG